MKFYIVVRDNKIVKSGRADELEAVIETYQNIIPDKTFENKFLAGNNQVTYLFLS